MTAPWRVRVGSRSSRRLAKPGSADARVADVLYCENEAAWSGLPAEAARELRAELDAREPWFLALGPNERVLYAGLLGAAALIESRHAAQVVILPLDRIADSTVPSTVASVGDAAAARARVDEMDGRLRAGANAVLQDLEADPISAVEQHLLRQYLQRAELGNVRRGWKDGFAQWMLCSEPAEDWPRLDHEIYRQRADLRSRFALPWIERLRVRRWLVRRGLSELGLALIDARDLQASRRSVAREACDVHVVGYLDSAKGFGTSGRNHRDALELAGLRTAATVLPDAGRTHPIAPRTPAASKATLFVVNGNELEWAMRYVDRAAVEKSHRIGLWAWETPHVPRRYLRGLRYVDEIWVPSGFVRDAFRPCTEKPVHVVPHPIRLPAATAVPGFEDARPNAPYLFFAFDYDALIARKNPDGLIAAFSSAFAQGAGPRLLIKTSNARHNREQHEEVLRLARSRSDIQVIDTTWPAGVLHDVVRNSLGVVSLHRSEGFGLLLAEAMAWGKPTIATGYSGNLEFQDEGNAFLVRYTMTRVPRNCGPFEAGQPWAEPDVDDAARAMRMVFAGGAQVQAKAQRAAQTVRERLAPHAVGARMKSLLDARALR